MPDVDVQFTLELAREAISPSSAERERLTQFANVLATGRLAPHSGAPLRRELREAGAASPGAVSRIARESRWAGRLGLAGALGAGILMGYLLRMVHVRASEERPAPEAPRPVVMASPENLAGDALPDTRSSDSPSGVDPRARVTSAPPAPSGGHGSARSAQVSGASRQVRAKTSPRGSESSSAPSSSWRSELTFLQRAELAVRERAGDRALGILKDLEKEVPAAAFREERDALRVMAQCLASTPGAAADASTYVRQFAGSAHIERVIELCNIDSPVTRETQAR